MSDVVRVKLRSPELTTLTGLAVNYRPDFLELIDTDRTWVVPYVNVAFIELPTVSPVARPHVLEE